MLHVEVTNASKFIIISSALREWHIFFFIIRKFQDIFFSVQRPQQATLRNCDDFLFTSLHCFSFEPNFTAISRKRKLLWREAQCLRARAGALLLGSLIIEEFKIAWASYMVTRRTICHTSDIILDMIFLNTQQIFSKKFPF